MGIIANIYRSDFVDGLCLYAALGVTKVTVVNADGPFNPSETAPAAMLVEGHHPGTVRCVPLNQQLDRVPGTMFSGAFVSASDSRFHDAVEKITGRRYGDQAVALHSRVE